MDRVSLSESNTRIAKNTIVLYFRMLLTLVVSLYTSRAILEVLGVCDYGVYNVVGGIVSIISFINGGLVSSIQRYITFELGRNDFNKLKIVFSTSLQILVLMSLLVVILAETAGIWFLNNKLVIPEDRYIAAFWVFQFSVFLCVVNFLSIPYNADIVAHEKMSTFAYISILEATLKLAAVLLLKVVHTDKLIVYAILMFLIQVLIRFAYTTYCYNHFEESKCGLNFSRVVFKDMMSFAGWGFFGGLSVAMYTQGLNMLLNMFFGPVVNAARGVAVQAQSVVQQFVGNFQMALNPQITKTYAIGELQQMHKLIFRSARFSFILLFIIALPILLETDFILKLWLKTVPNNTKIFLQIMLMTSLTFTATNPCAIANQATGNVKQYQIIVGGTLLLIVPLSYIALRLGLPAYSVFLVQFVVDIIAQFERMFILRKSIGLPIKDYFTNIYYPVILIVLFSIPIPILFRICMPNVWYRSLLVISLSILSVAAASYLFGLTRGERVFLKSKVLLSLNHINK